MSRCLGHYYSVSAFRRKQGFPGDWIYVKGICYVATSTGTWKRYRQ